MTGLALFWTIDPILSFFQEAIYFNLKADEVKSPMQIADYRPQLFYSDDGRKQS